MKVRFTIAVVAAADPKTNIRIVSRMQRVGQDVAYIFPPDLQPTAVHSDLISMPIITKALAQLKHRGCYRTLTVTLSDKIIEKYFDTEENPCFNDIYLEEYSPTIHPATSQQTDIKKVTPRSLSKDMVLEKFSGKSQNVFSWLTQFEAECVRLNVQQNQYPEVLRLFLEGLAVNDWFQIQLKTIGLTATWTEWKNRFADDFAPKGWSNIIFAFNYKYTKGSLSDYALKKLRLLLEADPSLTAISRINLVVIGLPDRVRNRIERAEVETQSDLIAKLQSLEFLSVSYSKPSSNNPQTSQLSTPSDVSTSKTDKFCTGCRKAGRTYRNHVDAECGFNSANKGKRLESSYIPRPIKVSNNIELEEVLNNNMPDPKN